MGIFSSLQNLFSGVSDIAEGSIGDVVGGLGDIPGVQELQDIATGAAEAVSPISDGVTEAAATATEHGQTVIEDITNNLGL